MVAMALEAVPIVIDVGDCLAFSACGSLRRGVVWSVVVLSLVVVLRRVVIVMALEVAPIVADVVEEFASASAACGSLRRGLVVVRAVLVLSVVVVLRRACGRRRRGGGARVVQAVTSSRGPYRVLVDVADRSVNLVFVMIGSAVVGPSSLHPLWWSLWWSSSPFASHPFSGGATLLCSTLGIVKIK